MFSRDTTHTVSNGVRTLRTERKITQEEFAHRVGVTRQTIVALEKGNYVPSVLLALRIAHELGKSVEEIFHYDKA